MGAQMSNKNSSHRDLRISIDGDCLSLSFNSAFGPISFSINLNELEAQVTRIVSGLVERLERDDPNVLTEIAMNRGVSTEEIRRSLVRLSVYQKRTRAQTATDEFIGGRDLELQGLIEQLIDNLPEGLEVMLMHLAMAAIVRTVPDVHPSPSSEVTSIDDELLALLSPHFKRSIIQLWERS
jgi:hypothetical protein